MWFYAKNFLKMILCAKLRNELQYDHSAFKIQLIIWIELKQCYFNKKLIKNQQKFAKF